MNVGQPHINLITNGTSTQSGNWFDVRGSRGNYGFQVTVAGTPSAGTITLVGSNDGTTADPTVLASYVIGTDTTGEIKFVIDKPVAYLRATIGTFTGGTTPKASAWVTAP